MELISILLHFITQRAMFQSTDISFLNVSFCDSYATRTCHHNHNNNFLQANSLTSINQCPLWWTIILMCNNNAKLMDNNAGSVQQHSHLPPLPNYSNFLQTNWLTFVMSIWTSVMQGIGGRAWVSKHRWLSWCTTLLGCVCVCVCVCVCLHSEGNQLWSPGYASKHVSHVQTSRLLRAVCAAVGTL